MTSRIAKPFVWRLEFSVRGVADVPLVENFDHILLFLKITKQNNISKVLMQVLVANSPKLHSNSGIFSVALGPFSKHRCCIEVHKLFQTPI